MYSPRHFLCLLLLIMLCTEFALLYPIAVAAATTDDFVCLTNTKGSFSQNIKKRENFGQYKINDKIINEVYFEI